MFRGMRRFKQQISNEDCIRLLKTEPRGVLSVFGEDGYPYGIPMNFVYHEGRLYFHCAAEGHKIDAIKNNNRVSFCVLDKGYRREGEWALNINSVVIFGTILFVGDKDRKIETLRLLGNKYDPSPEHVEREIEKYIDRVCMLELQIDHMTGKLVNES